MFVDAFAWCDPGGENSTTGSGRGWCGWRGNDAGYPSPSPPAFGPKMAHIKGFDPDLVQNPVLRTTRMAFRTSQEKWEGPARWAGPFSSILP